MTPDGGQYDRETEALESDALATLARLRSRFRGALLGLALGEALAAPVQLSRPGSFAPVRDLLGGGPYDLAPGAWTDDTAMTLILATSLLDRRACDPLDQLARFRRWQREGEGALSGECLGITASVSRALVEGRSSKVVRDGSDALVRVAPLAMWHYADESALRTDVITMAEVTSRDSTTLAAVETFAILMLRALRGTPIEALKENLVTLRAASAAGEALAVVEESMFAALSWKEAVLRAVNRGGDADVYGAATGQLAGAVFGVESIPAHWLARLADRERIESIADALLAEVVIRLESETTP